MQKLRSDPESSAKLPVLFPQTIFLIPRYGEPEMREMGTDLMLFPGQEIYLKISHPVPPGDRPDPGPDLRSPLSPAVTDPYQSVLSGWRVPGGENAILIRNSFRLMSSFPAF